MENVTRGLPESPARRATRIARVGASYGFGFVFGNRFVPRRRRAEPRRVGMSLRLSFEELGPTFAELGRFLSARRDLLPPDVAVELERTSVVVKPLTFAETRALVERELGNTLERLFLEFEEVPSRVGPFTQAHRAMLPGERPALAVVVRTGVRRDLLAMRPVADLARRRLSDRLPLDPSAAVAEFAAHAAQRRDMYFAAQTARRLKEMEGLRLRAPAVYRGYSSGRCVTFEAPGRPAPLEGDQYPEVSGRSRGSGGRAPRGRGGGRACSAARRELRPARRLDPPARAARGFGCLGGTAVARAFAGGGPGPRSGGRPQGRRAAARRGRPDDAFPGRGRGPRRGRADGDSRGGGRGSSVDLAPQGPGLHRRPP